MKTEGKNKIKGIKVCLQNVMKDFLNFQMLEKTCIVQGHVAHLCTVALQTNLRCNDKHVKI